MDARSREVAQCEVEQRSIAAMYARLDGERANIDAARVNAMASRGDAEGIRWARDTEVLRLTEALSQLHLAERSLCFGRIDSARGDSLHIGRVGLRAESGEILLVDWRADAARPFYAATMASPLGVRRRRHLRVEDRRVVGVSDEILDGTRPSESDVVGDEPLISALNASRSGRMREAASTLQREQDEIVRSRHRGVTVVDGGPGTGKTIVALHRAAYVIYAFPTIAERGVLIFGPNRSFLKYISDVLPSLGESNFALATTADLMGVEAPRSELDAVARAKGRRPWAEALARRVQERQPHGVSLRLTSAYGEAVLDAARVDAARRSALQGGIGHNRGQARFLEQIVDELVNELERQTVKEISDFEDDLKEAGIDLDRMFASRQRDPDVDEGASSTDAMDIDWERIRDELLDDAHINRIVSAVWPKVGAEALLRELLTDRDALAAAPLELSDEEISTIMSTVDTGWSEADLPLLDEARALVDGPSEQIFGHVVIDEAQQLSEMEWRMVMRRCPSRSMTIVGDLAQAGRRTTIASWADALYPFVEDRFVHHTLTVNYRTTAEILETTEPLLARIAPSQRLSRSIRHGEPPNFLVIPDGDVNIVIDDLIARLRRDHPDELIGLVTSIRRSREIERGSLGERVTTIPAAGARGLEFDTVIILDPDDIHGGSAAGLRDLYVAQTRATKRLITVRIASSEASDELSPSMTSSPRRGAGRRASGAD
jgi:DNA helicase IV